MTVITFVAAMPNVARQKLLRAQLPNGDKRRNDSRRIARRRCDPWAFRTGAEARDIGLTSSRRGKASLRIDNDTANW